MELAEEMLVGVTGTTPSEGYLVTYTVVQIKDRLALKPNMLYQEYKKREKVLHGRKY